MRKDNKAVRRSFKGVNGKVTAEMIKGNFNG